MENYGTSRFDQLSQEDILEAMHWGQQNDPGIYKEIMASFGGGQGVPSGEPAATQPAPAGMPAPPPAQATPEARPALPKPAEPPKEPGFFTKAFGLAKDGGGRLLDFGKNAVNWDKKDWDREKFAIEQYQNMMMGLPYDQTALADLTNREYILADEDIKKKQSEQERQDKDIAQILTNQNSLDTRRSGYENRYNDLSLLYMKATPIERQDIKKEQAAIRNQINAIDNDMARLGERAIELGANPSLVRSSRNRGGRTDEIAEPIEEFEPIVSGFLARKSLPRSSMTEALVSDFIRKDDTIDKENKAALLSNAAYIADQHNKDIALSHSDEMNELRKTQASIGIDSANLGVKGAKLGITEKENKLNEEKEVARHNLNKLVPLLQKKQFDIKDLAQVNAAIKGDIKIKVPSLKMLGIDFAQLGDFFTKGGITNEMVNDPRVQSEIRAALELEVQRLKGQLGVNEKNIIESR